MYRVLWRHLHAFPPGTYDLRICCNGVLSGLVTVTCMCGFVDPWAAVVCSGIAGAVYTGMSSLLLRCGIDDPLDSSAVHLCNGLLGTVMLAFVAKPEHVLALTGSPCGGVFYSSTGWLQLGLQLMGE
jgi:Amt family ammonium transporter